jgi:superfamily II DNA or RNA helicase
MTFSWAEVVKRLNVDRSQVLDRGQQASLSWIAKTIGHHGVVLADEVGTGKTRIACALVHAVVESGGRAAVVVPRGLMHQWESESKKLNATAPTPKSLTTLTEFLRNATPTGRTAMDERAAQDLWSKKAPSARLPEWCLISHGFRAPVVRSNSYPWRLSLPSLVRMFAASPKDKRSVEGRLLDWLDKYAHAWWEWQGMRLIASQIVEQTGPRADLLSAQLAALPMMKVSGSELEAWATIDVDKFGAAGAQLTERLLGIWLGDFDLVVIDEAHKSRGQANLDDEVSERGAHTVLARLVDVLLTQPPQHARRLCLTATPMELELSQWLDLLKRARTGIQLEQCQKVIRDFEQASRNALAAPDEARRIASLCAHSAEFAGSLAPYVTRRRRDDDRLIQEFGAAVCPDDGNSEPTFRPHRKVSLVPIAWPDDGSPWGNVLFAAEAMSHAARGLTNKDTKEWPRSVRDAYTKLAAGHVSCDLSDPDDPIKVPGPGSDVDSVTRAKIARVAYWSRQLREARAEMTNRSDNPNFDPDSEHPRVIAAVQEIERWTEEGEEKVLVFGVFLGPLRILRDVLAVRRALRAADRGRPIAHDWYTDPRRLTLAVGQARRMAQELNGRVGVRLDAPGPTPEVRSFLEEALRSSHDLYQRLRPSVVAVAKQCVDDWSSPPSKQQGMHHLGIDGIQDEVREGLEAHLTSFVLDDFLGSDSVADQPTAERVEELASEFFKTHVDPVLKDHNVDDSSDKEGAATREEALRATFCESSDDGTQDAGHAGTRQREHAVLLQGQTRMSTRRYMQAAFNRATSSPRVLIAQSQVGREGLNLHEACRVVVQFHAEWNPAVLEQQIGRVDRKGSLWERRAETWIKADTKTNPIPFIEVRRLVFEGTYDAFQWDKVSSRQGVFDASLFGALLPAEAWARVPLEHREQLRRAAPSFTPPGLPEAPIDPRTAVAIVGSELG